MPKIVLIYLKSNGKLFKNYFLAQAKWIHSKNYFFSLRHVDLQKKIFFWSSPDGLKENNIFSGYATRRKRKYFFYAVFHVGWQCQFRKNFTCINYLLSETIIIFSAKERWNKPAKMDGIPWKPRMIGMILRDTLQESLILREHARLAVKILPEIIPMTRNVLVKKSV